MSEIKQEVTSQEVQAAYRNYYDFHHLTYFQHLSYGSPMRDFFKFTGIGAFLDLHHIVTKEQARRIRLLAGPHAHALLSAHYALLQETGDKDG